MIQYLIKLRSLTSSSYLTESPKCWPPVLISIEETREETHVYLPPCWAEYLPSQILYWKRLCRSLYPPSHHFTNRYRYMGFDIQHILSSNGDPVENSDDTTLAIDPRLDDFLLQFQEALDLLTKVPTGRRSSLISTHFFQNSHHITISGGNFSSSTISNPVVYDPVV